MEKISRDDFFRPVVLIRKKNERKKERFEKKRVKFDAYFVDSTVKQKMHLGPQFCGGLASRGFPSSLAAAAAFSLKRINEF